jgi:hypothetical protein
MSMMSNAVVARSKVYGDGRASMLNMVMGWS